MLVIKMKLFKNLLFGALFALSVPAQAFQLYANVPPSAGGGGFAPTDLSNLTLWLDASDTSTLYQNTLCTTAVSSDGDPVGCWQDKSGNSRHVVQAIAGNKLTYKTSIQNGLSILRGDGTADRLQSAAVDYDALVGSQAVSVFYVINHDSTDGNCAVVGHGAGSSNRLTIYHSLGGTSYFEGFDSTGGRLSFTTPADFLMNF